MVRKFGLLSVAVLASKMSRQYRVYCHYVLFLQDEM